MMYNTQQTIGLLTQGMEIRLDGPVLRWAALAGGACLTPTASPQSMRHLDTVNDAVIDDLGPSFKVS